MQCGINNVEIVLHSDKNSKQAKKIYLLRKFELISSIQTSNILRKFELISLIQTSNMHLLNSDDTLQNGMSDHVALIKFNIYIYV